MDDTYMTNIKSVPITDYAQRLGFRIYKCGKYYGIKEHDSVRIDPTKNAFWRNSVFSKGNRGGSGSVIDFALEFGSCSDVASAIKEIAVMYGIERTKEYKPTYKNVVAEKNIIEPKREKGNVEYPQKADNMKRVWRYLYHERCIDNSVLKYFSAKGMLYQDTHGNCVFSTPYFACMRSTFGKKFAIDAKGCDYDECFYFKGKNATNTMVVCESVIDIMSYMSFLTINGQRYVDYSYLALTGTNKLESIFYHLSKESQLTNVILGLDNDKAGELAIKTIMSYGKEHFPSVKFQSHQAPNGKDWNKCLQLFIGER